jgi:hypothetical protein
MVHLTKAIIKKYGISKKAWAVARGGHAHSSGKSRMPKKRSARRYGRRLKRRFSKAKVPFETLIAVGTIPFTPAQSGWATPLSDLQAGKLDSVMSHMKSGFLGMDPNGSIDIMGALNPFNMERARYTKTIIYATLLGMVRRKITGRYTAPLFKKIPLIGRIVS